MRLPFTPVLRIPTSHHRPTVLEAVKDDALSGAQVRVLDRFCARKEQLGIVRMSWSGQQNKKDQSALPVPLTQPPAIKERSLPRSPLHGHDVHVDVCIRGKVLIRLSMSQRPMLGRKSSVAPASRAHRPTPCCSALLSGRTAHSPAYAFASLWQASPLGHPEQ